MPAAIKSTITETSLLIARLLVGLLFVFSGLIKANDPVGFGYKLQEYFEVFNLSVLNSYAVGIAIVLCALEIVFGALLLLGLYIRKVAWGLLVLILFFSFLTFFSAFFEVVTSCGCFGDAIPLTPWQSFTKDLILLALILVVFYNRKNIKPLFSNEVSQALALGGICVLSLAVGIYTFNFLPVIDFLPYKEGNNISQLMQIPEGAALDEYETRYKLQHKRTGEKRTVTDKVYLREEIWKDENWEITGDPTNRLIKAGYRAPISDLRITDAQDIEYTQEIIENPYYNLIVVAYDLNNTDIESLVKLNALALMASEQFNTRTILLTSSSAQFVEDTTNELKLVMETYYADNVPLKSMIRANPGLILLKGGKVVKKWHFHTLPSFDFLAAHYFENQ